MYLMNIVLGTYVLVMLNLMDRYPFMIDHSSNHQAYLPLTVQRAPEDYPGYSHGPPHQARAPGTIADILEFLTHLERSTSGPVRGQVAPY